MLITDVDSPGHITTTLTILAATAMEATVSTSIKSHQSSVMWPVVYGAPSLVLLILLIVALVVVVVVVVVVVF